MQTPKVSIVMLCWNRKDDVRESLTQIQAIDYESLEVIVVDNGSTDGTQKMIEEEFPSVHLIRMFKNIGIEAYNIGFENANGKYIVIIDDDSFPAPQSIKRMVSQFEQDNNIGIVAFDVRNFYSHDEVKKNLELTDNKSDVQSSYAMSFNGAGVGIRRDVFQQIGYYPEEFFLYNNELDVAFRIMDAGYTIKTYSDIVSYHKYSPVNRSSWRAPFYYSRNAFWLVWKNYPLNYAINITIQLIYSCFFYSLEQKTTIYLKAMFFAFLHSHKLKGKRKPVKEDIVKQLRIPWNVNFTFYR